ncbi:MAG: [protein-PII] uridylyltransferase [Gammaproteobacteria bacterium]|nr:[protein-PII] uridylyltransferase [Gammaproteobacteria bacterium]
MNISTPGTIYHKNALDFSADAELLDREHLRNEISAAGSPIPLLRKANNNSSLVLNNRFRNNKNIGDIVSGRAWVVDEILVLAWKAINWPDPSEISLVAVGGYGRGELLPYSDIDLLILTRKTRNKKYKDYISAFLTMLWDIGLEPGHSVRSVRQCKQEASEDITIATAMMESRLLTGPQNLYNSMCEVTSVKKIWPIKKFVRAKLDEQARRHHKYHDVDHALEPNVKTSPGGLRDIQTIGWICKRYFGTNSFNDLVNLGFLKELEKKMIVEGQHFLWKIRYGLHFLQGRSEDRLLFDKQKELSQLFGFHDDDKSLAIEKLMKNYYREVANLRELNDVLLQYFDEIILRGGEKKKIKPLNDRFQIRNDYIEVANPSVFEKAPSALLEIFVLMGDNPQIKGIHASTIRLLRDNRHLINENFRRDADNITLFIELLRTNNHMSLQLSRMARYGILGRYLPEFGKISGQMQHDLFHIYTVDAHTLQVVENMRKFRLPNAVESFPVAAHIFKNLPKVELLYIAGLYHDIAKGRGGDHSKLGRVDAIKFCERHKLSGWDTKLVSWLVDKHLLMSMTAQRKDINDPVVIREFAEHMGDKLHLDYLYAMTVADICATNPDLWNSWRATLLRQLYQNTRRALRLGLENPINRQERVSDKKQSAYLKLQEKGFSKAQIDNVWDVADDEYFVREAIANIIWHTAGIINFSDADPLILVQDIKEQSDSEGATQIFIYARNADYLFARCTAALEILNLNIQEARIFTSSRDYCLDTFTVLERSGLPVRNNTKREKEIISLLQEHLTLGNKPVILPKFRRTRKEKYFARSVNVELINPVNKSYSILEINCPDQPGVLACVGKVLAMNDIVVNDARITTLGERVEDLFFVTDINGKPIERRGLIEKLNLEITAELKGQVSS